MRVPEAVIHEQFEDEIVVVNMQSGHYFSLGGGAAALWSAIQEGAGEAELSSRLPAEPPSDDPARDVEAFVTLLRAEGLLVDESGAPAPDAIDVATWLESTSLRGTVEKFTDAEGLLLLDPIHDVDDSGWPSAKS